MKFNYADLDFDVINDRSIIQLPFEKILNEDGIHDLQQLKQLIPNIDEFKVTKIFPFLNTNDSLSVSRLGEHVTIPPFWAVFRVDIPIELRLPWVIRTLDNFVPLIEYAHYDFQVDFQADANDSLYDLKQEALFDPLGLADINIEEAWDIETGEQFIAVGVHDTGIDTLHPDLRVPYGNGYYYTNSNELPVWGTDFEGHGTSVAGIIGAKRNNDIGIAGIAGGDGSDTTGCTLVDIKMPWIEYNVNPNLGISYLLAGIVDGARSIGSSWDYEDYVQNEYNEDTYFHNAPGLGIHVGNHSYILKAVLPQNLDDSLNGKDIVDDPDLSTLGVGDCSLCREAYLFSLRNGVINVVARGNSASISPNTDPTYSTELFPQTAPDGWVILVGASGYDGTTIRDGINQSPIEVIQNFWSLYGANMDLIAPGSDSIVYSTIPTTSTSSDIYARFNGTSAATPHVTGVVALLLSHYNKDCYNRRNLSIEDVEYILEESATDILDSDYDEISGWGRLNAGEALKMIENPTKQIVHPDSLTSSTIISRDTIALGYNQAFVGDGWGPISQGFPLVRETEYEVERVLVENEYYFGDYITDSTQIIDVWTRPSASNSIEFYRDTIVETVGINQGGGGLIPTPKFNFDFYDQSPYDSIVSIDLLNNTIKLQGYFYHFIGRYNEVNESGFVLGNVVYVDSLVNIWLPIDPQVELAEMAFSIYIIDSSLTSLYDFPCDADFLDFLDTVDHNFDGIGNLDEVSSLQLVVSPNPFQTELHIELGKFAFNQLILYTLEGKEILRKTFIGNNTLLDTSNLSRGMYFLHIENEWGEETVKIEKQ